MKVYALLAIVLLGLVAVSHASSESSESSENSNTISAGPVDPTALKNLKPEESDKLGGDLAIDLAKFNQGLEESIKQFKNPVGNLKSVMSYANTLQKVFATISKSTVSNNLVAQFAAASGSLYGIDAAVRTGISLLVNSWITEVNNANRIMDVASAIKDMAGDNSEGQKYNNKLLGTVHFSVKFYSRGNGDCFQDPALAPLRERLYRLASVARVFQGLIGSNIGKEAGECFKQVAPIIIAWGRDINNFMSMAHKCSTDPVLSKSDSAKRSCALCSNEEIRDAIPEMMVFTFEAFEGAFWHALRVPPPVHDAKFLDSPLSFISKKWQKHVHNKSHCKKLRDKFPMIHKPAFGIPWDKEVAGGKKATTKHLAKK